MLWNECEDEILIAVTQQICKNITHLPYKLFCHLLSDINDYTFDICLCFTLSLFNFQVKPLTNFNRLYVFKTITTFPSVSISIALPSMHIECSPFAFHHPLHFFLCLSGEHGLSSSFYLGCIKMKFFILSFLLEKN